MLRATVSAVLWVSGAFVEARVTITVLPLCVSRVSLIRPPASLARETSIIMLLLS